MIILVVIILLVTAFATALFVSHTGIPSSSSSYSYTTTSTYSKTEITTATTTINLSSNNNNKLIILYVNQGNALVDQNNFSSLLSFAKSNRFNTIFFQIYRSGSLLFNSANLSNFVVAAHAQNLSLYFALYFTAAGEPIPSSIYPLGEDGINLDMSTLSTADQENLLSTLRANYHEGKIAVTTTNLESTLKPDILILETYDFSSDEQYIHPGMIASVEPLTIPSYQEYEEEFNYALSKSDGVMVFDYYGLLRTGY
jgi:hypothetical protein